MLPFEQKRRFSLKELFFLLGLMAVISVVLGLLVGSVSLPFNHLFSPSIDHDIFIHIRLPRVACAFIVGGSLALAGALMQALLGNPLADPYVLGVSGGSAVAVLLAMMLGLAGHFFGVFAFLGGLLSMLIVYGLAQTRNHLPSVRLLLTGIIIATGFSALINFILTIAPEKNLRGMMFWLMGDLSYARFSVGSLIILMGCLVVNFSLAKSLNILSHGELQAKSLGVNTKRLNILLYLTSSLLTASAVSMAGCIGFVGLIVPHMLRLMGNSDHRFVLPASVLLGGSLLTIADMLARSLFAPIELPVGIITAFIGVPVFLVLLRRGLK
jgi:iron complex transport system permease protein